MSIVGAMWLAHGQCGLGGIQWLWELGENCWREQCEALQKSEDSKHVDETRDLACTIFAYCFGSRMFHMSVGG